MRPIATSRHRFSWFLEALLLPCASALERERLLKLFLPLAIALSISASAPLASAQIESQLEGNIPSSDVFEKYLKRDIAAYFKDLRHQDVIVTYVPLRDGPTQSGVAYPKYYLWVKILAEGKLVDEGAVRVAAVDRVRFEVTDYAPKSDIVADPTAIESVFPAPLIGKIRLLAGLK